MAQDYVSVQSTSDRVAIKLKSPSVCTLFGSTGSGKTVLCRSIMEHGSQIYDKELISILYCYTEHQDSFDDMKQSIKNVRFHQGLPTSQTFADFVKEGPPGHRLVILDDLMSTVLNSADIIQLVCVTSHHKNISVIIILQNLYAAGKFSKTVSLQSQYLIACQSARDTSHLQKLSYQIYGASNSHIIPDAMKQVTSRYPYPYLLVDLSHAADPTMRLRSRILPGDTMEVYVPVNP